MMCRKNNLHAQKRVKLGAKICWIRCVEHSVCNIVFKRSVCVLVDFFMREHIVELKRDQQHNQASVLRGEQLKRAL